MKTEKEILKHVSIRGRLAYGALCIENIFEAEDISNVELNQLLNVIWSFTSSKRLNEWDSIIKEIRPIAILSTHPNARKSLKTISQEKAECLKISYSKTKKCILEIIDEVIWLGLSNLYLDSGEYSLPSLELTIEVIKLMDEYSYIKPDLSLLKKFSYAEDNVWGEIFYRDDVFD